MGDSDVNVDLPPSAVSDRLGQQNVRQIERAEKQAQRDQFESDRHAQAVAQFAQETVQAQQPDQPQQPEQAQETEQPLNVQQRQESRVDAVQDAQTSFTRNYVSTQEAKQTLGGMMSTLGASAVVAGLIGLIIAVVLIVILVRTWRARTQLKAFGEALDNEQVRALKDRGVNTDLNANTGLFGLTGNVVLFSLFGALPMLVYSLMGILSGFTMRSAGRAVANT